MYCKKCGHPVPEGTKFCSKCGAAQNIPEADKKPASSAAHTAPAKTAKPKNKKKWILGIAIALVAIIAAIVIIPSVLPEKELLLPTQGRLELVDGTGKFITTVYHYDSITRQKDNTFLAKGTFHFPEGPLELMSTYNSDGHMLTMNSFSKDTYTPDKYGLCKARTCTNREGKNISETGNYNITYKDKDFLGRPKQATATLVESGDFYGLPSKIEYTLEGGKIQEVVEYLDEYKYTITYEKFDIE